MSPITDALLIGSYAAYLRGVLPTWRSGHVGDADFICTRPAATQIMGLFGTAVVEHVPDRCFRIGRNGEMHIDIDLRGHLLPLIKDHAGAMQIEINGQAIQCLVARPELIAALRAASADVVPKAVQKAARDVVGYEVLGVQVPPHLAKIAQNFRKPGDGN